MFLKFIFRFITTNKKSINTLCFFFPPYRIFAELIAMDTMNTESLLRVYIYESKSIRQKSMTWEWEEPKSIYTRNCRNYFRCWYFIAASQPTHTCTTATLQNSIETSSNEFGSVISQSIFRYSKLIDMSSIIIIIIIFFIMHQQIIVHAVATAYRNVV